MERLPAGWRSIDASSDDQDDPEGRDGVDQATGAGGEPAPAVASAAAAGAGGSSSGPRTLLALAGLVAVAVAAALAVLTSAAPQPVVLIGDQTADVFLEGGGGAADRTPAIRPTESAAGSAQLVVDVGGAVARPGVYQLPAGSRVADALREAGGFSTSVDVAAVERALNLAAPVADGTKLHIPSLADMAAGETDAPGTAAPEGGTAPRGDGRGGPMNLNTATAEELDSLPGIGPVTAAKIIAAREEQPFATLDELDERGVVGPGTLAKIRELVTIGP